MIRVDLNACNPLGAMERREAAGRERRHAGGLSESGRDLVAKDLLENGLAAALARQTARMGGLIAAAIALATTVLGVLVSLK